MAENRVIAGASNLTEKDHCTFVIEYDEPLSGDLEKDAKYLWLELHKRLCVAEGIFYDENTKRAMIIFEVSRAKS
jgi:hypothetical protein